MRKLIHLKVIGFIFFCGLLVTSSAIAGDFVASVDVTTSSRSDEGAVREKLEGCAFPGY